MSLRKGNQAHLGFNLFLSNLVCKAIKNSPVGSRRGVYFAKE